MDPCDEMPKTSWWLEWMDDPIGLAGTGRKVGSLSDAKELVIDRYHHARFEGPYFGGSCGALSTLHARVGGIMGALIREFPSEMQEKEDRKSLAERVDAVRSGKMTHEDYDAWVRRGVKK